MAMYTYVVIAKAVKIKIRRKKMKNEVPDPDELKELKELIRVKIDIYGLTMEDIEYLRQQSSRIVSEREELRI